MRNFSQLVIFVFILSLFNSQASPPCGVHGHNPCSFVPAKPGHTPACAAGSTFCESIKNYPMNVIKKLLKIYPTKDMLTDELKIEFKKPEAIVIEDHSSHHDHHPFGNYFGHGSDSGRNSDESSSFEWHGSNRNFKNGGHQNYPDYFQSKAPSFRNYYRRSRQINSLKSDRRTQEEFLSRIAPARSKRQISENREQLCEIRTNYINPQAALNSRGNWMYVVNGVDPQATQLVRTETCTSQNQQCSNLCQLPNGYSSVCEQKYIQKRLIALDSRGDRLYSDTFWFPSCCVCTLSNR